MIKRLYYWFYHKTSASHERGQYSGGYWQGKIRHQVVEWMRDRIGRVLEIGCAEGLLLIQIAAVAPGAELVGIDLDAQRIAKAQERIVQTGKSNISVLCADAMQTGFPDKSFDVVICVNFLLMLPSVEAMKNVLMEARRLLRPGGRIIFEFRNSRNLLFVLKYRFARFYDATVANQPLRTYNPRLIQQVVESCGFATCKVANLGFGKKLFAPIIMFEVEKK